MIETQWRYAGFWMRFLAYLVDGFILTLLLGIVLVPVAIAVGFWGAITEGGRYDDYGRFENEVTPFIVLGYIAFIGLTIAGQWLYFALFESSSHQATPGKMLVGVRVVDARGERLTFGRATGRTLGKVISGMFCNAGYIIAAFTERKQALHDMMASTYVVEKQTAPPPPYQSAPPQTPPSAG